MFYLEHGTRILGPTVEARKLEHVRPPGTNQIIKKENPHNCPTSMFHLLGSVL